ncbi:hypothetical protein JW979_07345, partial [bacterium]|nr:hypothetical protein [candidate division CSSED10-310 bacterium]
REWGEELRPRFLNALKIVQPGMYRTILQAFLDFDIPDDAEPVMKVFLNGKVEDFADQKLLIRTVYVLDEEYAQKSISEYLENHKKDEDFNPELKTYLINTLERLEWYGNWEITDEKETAENGLKDERIRFEMANSLDPNDDIVNFSMPMSISWDPGVLKPIGTEETYTTNNVSFEVTPDELTLRIDYPKEHTYIEKKFTIKEGTGRNVGRIYLQFPIPGSINKRTKEPETGWLEIEKIG